MSEGCTSIHLRLPEPGAFAEDIPPLVSAALAGPDIILKVLQTILLQESQSCCPLPGANRALFCAVFYDSAECVRALILGAGADPRKLVYGPHGLYNATAVHMAAARGRLSALKAILCLDTGHASVDTVDGGGLSPAHVAAACGRAEAVRILVQHDPAALTVEVHGEFVPLYHVDEMGMYTEPYTFYYDERLTPYGRNEYKALRSVYVGWRRRALPAHFAAATGNENVLKELTMLALRADLCSPARRLRGYRRIRKEKPLLRVPCATCSERRCNCELQRQMKTSLCIAVKCMQYSSLQRGALDYCLGAPWKAVDQVDIRFFLCELIESVANLTFEIAQGRVIEIHTPTVLDVIDARSEHRYNPLLLSANRGHLSTVRLLASLGANVHARGKQMRSALHMAAWEGQVDMVEVLVTEYGHDVNDRDECGMTACHYAVLQDNPAEIIEKLSSLGADVDARDAETNCTSLYCAAEDGFEECFKALLRAGADPNAMCGWDDENSALYTLGAFGHFDLLLDLFDYAHEHGIKLDVNRKYEEGKTLLYTCVLAGACVKTISAVINEGADVNTATKQGWTPLLLAAKSSGPDELAALIAAGADLNCVQEDGWSALHLAVISNTVESVRVLISAGADVNFPNSFQANRTPLHEAVMRNSDMVRTLLAAGADHSCVTTFERYTALMLTAERGDVESAKVLLEAGADVHARDYICNYTPMHMATRHNCTAVVSLLLDSGCNVDLAANLGQTCLSQAAKRRWSDRELLYLLLCRGADVNRATSTGDTPLHMAAVSGRLPSIYWLLECGADIEARNNAGDDALLASAKEGRLKELVFLGSQSGGIGSSRDEWDRTAMHIAAEFGHVNIVKYFLRQDSEDLAPGESGIAQLLLAASAGNADTIRTLLRHSANVLDDIAPRSAFTSAVDAVSSDDLSGITDDSGGEWSESDGGSVGQKCPICRVNFINGAQVRTLACAHVFHDNCAVMWFGSEYGSNQLSCPLCRRPLMSR